MTGGISRSPKLPLMLHFLSDVTKSGQSEAQQGLLSQLVIPSPFPRLWFRSFLRGGCAPQGSSEGKACALCPRKDTDKDLVDGGPTKWGLPPWDGKSMGKVCYYCRRVWRANYSPAPSLEKFILHCTRNKPLFDTFSR